MASGFTEVVRVWAQGASEHPALCVQTTDRVRALFNLHQRSFLQEMGITQSYNGTTCREMACHHRSLPLKAQRSSGKRRQADGKRQRWWVTPRKQLPPEARGCYRYPGATATQELPLPRSAETGTAHKSCAGSSTRGPGAEMGKWARGPTPAKRLFSVDTC